MKARWREGGSPRVREWTAAKREDFVLPKQEGMHESGSAPRLTGAMCAVEITRGSDELGRENYQ